MATQTVTLSSAVYGTVSDAAHQFQSRSRRTRIHFANILESIGLDTAKLSTFFDVLAMTL